MSEKYKRVLLSPLDWGLGHAARCIPLIARFVADGSSVTVFASPALIEYFRLRFSEISFVVDNTKPISYGPKGIGFFGLLKMAFIMKKRSRTELKLCAGLCAIENYDLIVSDNRYGFRNSQIQSILVTHQLVPIPPRVCQLFMPLVRSFLKKTYASFYKVWVPDFHEYPGLAGCLSHPEMMVPNAIYIGLLSRFSKMKGRQLNRKSQSVLVIASGPARHRRQMAIDYARVFTTTSSDITVVGAELNETSNISYYASPPDDILYTLIMESEIIVAASGYSTLMDLCSAGRSAILVPTRGQTEQNYLANVHKESFVIAQNSSELQLLVSDIERLKENLKDRERNLIERFCQK